MFNKKKEIKNNEEKNNKKIDKSKIFVKVMALILAMFMILSIAGTCIFAILRTIQE